MTVLHAVFAAAVTVGVLALLFYLSLPKPPRRKAEEPDWDLDDPWKDWNR